MESECLEFRKIEDRCRELKKWLLTNAPECMLEEKHLMKDSQEHGYWAHGYLSGLLDVLRLFTKDISTPASNKEDAPRSRYAA